MLALAQFLEIKTLFAIHLLYLSSLVILLEISSTGKLGLQPHNIPSITNNCTL